MNQTHVDQRQGQLCIRHTDTSHFEPKLIKLWYPVCSFMEWHRPMLEKVPRQVGNGRYEVQYAGQWVTLDLTNGGATLPLDSETADVPKPRGKAEYRWEAGCWQKRLKYGWKNV